MISCCLEEFHIMRKCATQTEFVSLQNCPRIIKNDDFELLIFFKFQMDISTNLKNCGPPIPIAWDVGPQTRRVNSFSIGSGSVYEMEIKNYFLFILFYRLKRQIKGSYYYYNRNIIQVFILFTLNHFHCSKQT